jgi:phosphoribosylanthranilate isomerase
MTKVQVCGIRTLEDALICEKANADSLGFVNVEGRARSIPLDNIKDIIEVIGPMTLSTLIGFPKNSEEIIKKADFVGADAVQIYTLDTIELERVRDCGFRVYRAVSIDVQTGKLEVSVEKLNSFAKVCDMIIFEPSLNKITGGLGLQYDYEGILISYINHCRRFGVAGGLNPQNVESALKIGPYSVDVSSGVESKLGTKSEEKIIEFIKRCKN